MSDKTKTPPADTDAWIAQNPGDTLEGVVTDIDTAWSKWRERQDPNNPDGGWYPLLTVKTDDGEEFKLHGFRTVLFNELTKRRPIPGERITVVYKGPGKAKDGMNAPEIYRVTVHGRDAETAAANVYGRLGGTHSPSAAPEPDRGDVAPDTDDLGY